MSDKNFDSELSDTDLEQAAGGIIGNCTGGVTGFPIKPVKPIDIGGPIVVCGPITTGPVCELPTEPPTSELS